MVKPRFPGHVEAPSATRRATDKWAHDTMRPEQLDSGSTHTSQPQEGCALLHPLQGVSLLSTPLQWGILKHPALRVVVVLAFNRIGFGRVSYPPAPSIARVDMDVHSCDTTMRTLRH